MNGSYKVSFDLSVDVEAHTGINPEANFLRVRRRVPLNNGHFYRLSYSVPVELRYKKQLVIFNQPSWNSNRELQYLHFEHWPRTYANIIPNWHIKVWRHHYCRGLCLSWGSSWMSQHLWIKGKTDPNSQAEQKQERQGREATKGGVDNSELRTGYSSVRALQVFWLIYYP